MSPLLLTMTLALQIAVNDSGGMRSAQSVGHLGGVENGFGYGKTLFGNQLQQSLAGHELHDHVLDTGVFENVINSDDVGMVQRGGGLRFIDKARGIRDRRTSGGQDLMATKRFSRVSRAL